MNIEEVLLPGEERGYEIVDLQALRRNMAALRNSLSEKMNIVAVVKANAYGLGAIPVAKALDEFVWGYAVATFPEAVELRDAGIVKPVILLGPVPDRCYETAVSLGIRPVLFTREMGAAFSKAAEKAGKKGVYHIAVDTGMTRIGLTPDEDGEAIVKDLLALPCIEAEGIFTHLATIDCPDKSPALRQKDRFTAFVKDLQAQGIDFPLIHCANSVASITERAFEAEGVFNGCRYGICLYGDFPKETLDDCSISVEPVASLYSQVTYVKTVGKGTRVGYGGTYECTGDTKIATISFGYADGYPRSLSNKGQVLIRGHRVPIVGRVCMDQFMVDVTAYPDIKAGDTVTLLGKDGGEEITLRDLDRWGGRFSYEFLCDISPRVKRVYKQ